MHNTKPTLKKLRLSLGALSPPKLPQIHPQKATKISPTNMGICKSCGKMVSKYSAVPKRKKATRRSIILIQAPGRGKSLAQCGFRANSKYGKLIPRPTATKTITNTGKLWVNAQLSTPPRKGPLQGVAKIVVIIPVI